ncbi:MAG: FeoA family protein [Eubacteriales bacterium]|jgi:ferrous iron transport protein A
MTLLQADLSTPYLVESVETTPQAQRRLRSLGLLPGTPIQLLGRKSGSIICWVRGTRLALGSEIAQGITLREVAHP